MSLAAIDPQGVAECRRELLNVVIDFTKGVRGQFPPGFANHRAACDGVIEELVALRTGRVQTDDELQLRLFEPPRRTAA